MGSRYHVKIAGQGFLLKSGSYSRSAVALSSGTGTASPRPGWRWWHQSDWRGGDGQRTTGDVGSSTTSTGGTTGDRAGRWMGGYGVEIGEPGGLALGPAMRLSYPSTEAGFPAMAPFRGKLFAASISSGMVYRLDGAGWGVDWNSGKGATASLCRHGDRLYAGSGSDGTVFVRDGVGWSTVFQVEGAISIPCMASYEVWDPAARATVPRLFLGCRFPDGEARVYRWDGTAITEVHGCRETNIETMTVYGGRLFVATSESGNGVQGRVICYDGRSGSGEWAEAIWLPDNYVAGWAVFDNLLFCGSGVSGRLWAFDGNRMSEAYSLSAPGLEYPGPLRALVVCDGRLHVGYEHPTQGAALLAKLPAQGVGRKGSRLIIGEEDLGESRYGWFTPCTTGVAATTTALAIYNGQLYMACEAAGAASIYRMEPASHRDSGLLETSFLDGGLPGIGKLLRSVTLTHDKLLAGQYIDVRFSLEGSDGFQRLEGFRDPSACDRSLTTADWRAGDALVRLKGMPTQGFSGKRLGDMAVRHTAWKLASPNPNSPPAVFAEEFADAEYAAIAAEGDGVATTRCTIVDGYAHQLFQFDLSGLTPVGLRPRAICYGLGGGSGTSSRGAILRIWNHATGSWDAVGTNQAAPDDDPAARTIQGFTPDLGSYLGPSGKVYLSLRSSHGASDAVPSEIGADLVELSAFWSGDGEVVSEPLRMPAAEPVSEASLTLLSYQLPSGTDVELYMSADGGEHWEQVESGVPHSFAHPGLGLRWRARLLSADGLSTPELRLLKVDYMSGRWHPLGRSDTEGSTSATFCFENGATARRVAFQIELGSSDPAGSPRLADIALQYALNPEIKRRWEMDLICEGAAGAPLRLLDGSREGKTGAELSLALWHAVAQGIASFEDVDGSRYRVWFEGLEERLSDAAQDRGVQTVVRCRLIEG